MELVRLNIMEVLGRYKAVLLLAGMFCLSLVVSANTNSNHELDSIKPFYDAGRYQEVIEIVSEAEKQEYADADLFYNKANAHYKLGNKAEAIQYYLKALKLQPGHEDAAFNLGIVELSLLDKFEDLPSLSASNFFRRINSALGYGVLGGIGILLLFTALALAYLSKAFGLGVKKQLLWATFIIGAVLGVLSSVQKSAVKATDKAVVALNGVEIKSAPNSDGTLLFELNEGTSVTVLESDGQGWLKIQTKDGNQGWVKAENTLSV